MQHIPILRAGQAYKSLAVNRVPHFKTGETVVEVSQANRGLISRDFMQAAKNQEILRELTVEELLAICAKAADIFENDALPLGDDDQTPEQYVEQLSSTTGMPMSLCRMNMSKITGVLRQMREVLRGLTRGLDLSILDHGWHKNNGSTLSFSSLSKVLGAILPSNSPGVHSLWLPAIPLKTPLVLKPGAQEPWSPFRLAQAFIAAGCPKEAFSFYPTDHGGATEILLKSGRSMLFGDKNTVQPWLSNPGVEIHGPGWSKIIIGEDKIDDWEDYLDLMVKSVTANGGRSCINASGVWVPKYGREIAEALAERIAKIVARPMDDPQAAIAAFPNKEFAKMLSEAIDGQLADGKATDLTLKHRGTERQVEVDDCAFVQPTVVWCENHDHPLAQSEYLFPFVAVVETPQEELLQNMGYSLIATAITEDQKFIDELLSSPNVDRLNIGEIPTVQISWDQPHEGNLFEHLYRQRSLQIAKEHSLA